MVKHFYAKFGDPSCVGLKNRQTAVKTVPPSPTASGTGNYEFMRQRANSP